MGCMDLVYGAFVVCPPTLTISDHYEWNKIYVKVQKLYLKNGKTLLLFLIALFLFSMENMTA